MAGISGEELSVLYPVEDQRAVCDGRSLGCWKDPETAEVLQTYTVITTKANPLMEQIHNKKKRMPVLLPKDHERDWIDPSLSKQAAEALLVTYDETLMEAFTISRLITSNYRNPNVPEVQSPFSYPELGSKNEQTNLL